MSRCLLSLFGPGWAVLADARGRITIHRVDDQPISYWPTDLPIPYRAT